MKANVSSGLNIFEVDCDTVDLSCSSMTLGTGSFSINLASSSDTLTFNSNISCGTVSTAQVGTGTNNIQLLSSFPSSNTGSTTGMGVTWSNVGGLGETDLIGMGQNGPGGFAFYSSSKVTAPTLLLTLYPNSGTYPGATFASGLPVTFNTTPTCPTASSGNSSTSVATTAFVQNAISSVSTGNPTGTVLMYAGYSTTSSNTPPAGYLWCDGTAYSQTGTYANLYSVIGTIYNTSSSISSSDFCVPYFHTGTGSSGVMPIAGGFTSTNQGTLGVAQSSGSTITKTQPTIYGGNNMIYNTQIPPHQHKTANNGDNYIVNVNVQTYSMLTGTTTIATGASSIGTFPNDTGNMVTGASGGSGGSDVYTSNNTQGEFYPPYCSVMFIIKY
jgi:hypothetical protein